MSQVQSTPQVNNADDAEQMRLAFEEFMLKGKGSSNAAKSGDSTATTTTTTSSNKKKKKKKRPSTGPSPQKTVTNQTSPSVFKDKTTSISPNKPDQPSKKKYYQLLRSFSNKIQQSWFEIDDQISAVLESIVGIRGRLPLEWKLLNSYDGTRGGYVKNSNEMGAKNWKCNGFRGKDETVQRPMHLHRDDVQLALDYDLEQHEKMITALRSLISELSECHESLGRLVDTIWAFHLESQGQDVINMSGEEDVGSEIIELDLLVQNATDLFQALSMELYRKQCLIPALIETTNDEMLGASLGLANSDITSLTVARSCYKSWPRQLDEQLVAWLLKLGSPQHA